MLRQRSYAGTVVVLAGLKVERSVMKISTGDRIQR